MQCFPAIATSGSLPPNLDWMLTIWLGILGACIGSFLNVVIYRLPRNMSLIHPGSACPSCGKAIRWYDNIPVLSWFLLSAKCRWCGQRISGRYPAIEALVACIFLLLACVGPLAAGWNLPAAERSTVGLAGPLKWGSVPHLLLLWAYHVALLSTLIAMTAIAETKGEHRYPWRLWWSMLAVGLLMGICWPMVRPVPLFHGVLQSGVAVGLLEGLAGTLAGAAVAIAVRPVLPTEQQRPSWAASALVGSYLGVQAALAIGVVATAGCSLSLLIRCCQPSWLRWLIGVTLGWLVAWRWLQAELDAIGPATGVTILLWLLVCLLCSAGMACAAQRFARR